MDRNRHIKLDAGAFLSDIMHKDARYTLSLILFSSFSIVGSLLKLFSSKYHAMSTEAFMVLICDIIASSLFLISIIYIYNRFSDKIHSRHLYRPVMAMMFIIMVIYYFLLYLFLYYGVFSHAGQSGEELASAFYFTGAAYLFLNLLSITFILSFFKSQQIRWQVSGAFKIVCILGILTCLAFPVCYFIAFFTLKSSHDFFLTNGIGDILRYGVAPFFFCPFWMLLRNAGYRIDQIFSEVGEAINWYEDEESLDDSDMKLIPDKTVTAAAKVSTFHIDFNDIDDAYSEEEEGAQIQDVEITEKIDDESEELTDIMRSFVPIAQISWDDEALEAGEELAENEESKEEVLEKEEEPEESAVDDEVNIFTEEISEEPAKQKRQNTIVDAFKTLIKKVFSGISFIFQLLVLLLVSLGKGVVKLCQLIAKAFPSLKKGFLVIYAYIIIAVTQIHTGFLHIILMINYDGKIPKEKKKALEKKKESGLEKARKVKAAAFSRQKDEERILEDEEPEEEDFVEEEEKSELDLDIEIEEQEEVIQEEQEFEEEPCHVQEEKDLSAEEPGDIDLSTIPVTKRVVAFEDFEDDDVVPIPVERSKEHILARNPGRKHRKKPS